MAGGTVGAVNSARQRRSAGPRVAMLAAALFVAVTLAATVAARRLSSGGGGSSRREGSNATGMSAVDGTVPAGDDG